MKSHFNSYERNFILDCIRVYKALPCLWKVKSKEYRDRQKKNDAYGILVNKFRERYPEADREFVKKKINSLRTNYRKELKKIAELKKSNADPMYDVHESSLWYFTELSFLRDQEMSAKSISFIDQEMENERHKRLISVSKNLIFNKTL